MKMIPVRSPLALVVLGLGVLIALAATHEARAQSDAARQAIASQLFDEAQALTASGNIAEACPKYAESQRVDPQLGTLLYLAECYEKLGKTASAWATFKDAADLAAQRKDTREAPARARVSILEAKLPRLTLVVGADTPAGTEIRRDGEVVGRAVWGSAMPLDPGRHVIAAKAPGFKEWSTLVDVPSGVSGSQVSVTIPPLEKDVVTTSAALPAPLSAAVSAGPGAQRRAVEPGAPKDKGDGTRRIVGYAVSGLGAVGLGLGVILGLGVDAKLSDRQSVASACGQNCGPADQSRVDQLTSQARDERTWAYVSFVAGGAAVLGGAVLVVSGWPTRGPTGLTLSPWTGARSAGVTLGGPW
jgi:hypothetical protein